MIEKMIAFRPILTILLLFDNRKNSFLQMKMVKLFDLQQRTIDDECAVDSKNLYNQSGFEYSITNFYDSEMKDLVEFSSDQPNLRFQNGYGTPGSVAMAESSRIRNNFDWTPRGRTPLPSRIYQAVPDLSHGMPNPDDESKLFHVPHDVVTREITEEDLTKYFKAPLLPEVEKTMQNPETVVSSAWVHGGADTRGAFRDPEYLSRNGFVKDSTGVWTRSK